MPAAPEVKDVPAEPAAEAAVTLDLPLTSKKVKFTGLTQNLRRAV
jgi:hypothetical protein